MIAIHMWLSDSSRVHQIRFWGSPLGKVTALPPAYLAGLKGDPTSKGWREVKGSGRGGTGKGMEQERKRKAGKNTT